MEQRIKDLEERIIALEGQVRMLKSAQAAPAPEQPAAAPAEATAQAAAQAPSPAAAQVGHGADITVSRRTEERIIRRTGIAAKNLPGGLEEQPFGSGNDAAERNTGIVDAIFAAD